MEGEIAELRAQKKVLKKLADQKPASSSSELAEPRKPQARRVTFASSDDDDLDEFCEDIRYTMDPVSADDFAEFHPMARDRPRCL